MLRTILCDQPLYITNITNRKMCGLQMNSNNVNMLQKSWQKKLDIKCIHCIPKVPNWICVQRVQNQRSDTLSVVNVDKVFYTIKNIFFSLQSFTFTSKNTIYITTHCFKCWYKIHFTRWLASCIFIVRCLLPVSHSIFLYEK